jgi:AMP phosphorylase
LLETRDSLKVLEQAEDRPMELEKLAIEAATKLLELCIEDASDEKKEEYKTKYKSDAKLWVTEILTSGKALSKLREIIKAQKGDPDIKSLQLHPGKYCSSVKTDQKGKIKSVSSKNITTIAKILGAPEDSRAGMFLNKRLGDEVKEEDELFMLYSDSEYRLKEAIDSLPLFPIFNVEK